MTYDLSRFIDAHNADYDTALSEIQSGKKQTHWMWYIFPQVQGLGHSKTSKYYAIKNKEEAKAYIEDPLLSSHLHEISKALLTLPTNNALDIFGYPDNMKLRSSMTLFNAVSDDPVYREVLIKYFDGERCTRTLAIINHGKGE
ncbi:MAG: DUF1810 domain-containing protein [bacterium]